MGGLDGKGEGGGDMRTGEGTVRSLLDTLRKFDVHLGKQFQENG